MKDILYLSIYFVMLIYPICASNYCISLNEDSNTGQQIENIQSYFMHNCWNNTYSQQLQFQTANINKIPNTMFEGFVVESQDINGQKYVQLNSSVKPYPSDIPNGQVGDRFQFAIGEYSLVISGQQYYDPSSPNQRYNLPTTEPGYFTYSIDSSLNMIWYFPFNTKESFKAYFCFPSNHTFTEIPFVGTLTSPVKQIRGPKLNQSIYWILHLMNSEYVVALTSDWLNENRYYTLTTITPTPLFISNDHTGQGGHLPIQLYYSTYSMAYLIETQQYMEKIPYAPNKNVNMGFYTFTAYWWLQSFEFSLIFYSDMRMEIQKYNQNDIGYFQKQYTSTPLDIYFDYDKGNANGQFYVLYQDKVEIIQYTLSSQSNDYIQSVNSYSYPLDVEDHGKFKMINVLYIGKDDAGMNSKQIIISSDYDNTYQATFKFSSQQIFTENQIIVQRDEFKNDNPEQSYFDYVVRFVNEKQGSPFKFRLNNIFNQITGGAGGGGDSSDGNGSVSITFSMFELLAFLFISLAVLH